MDNERHTARTRGARGQQIIGSSRGHRDTRGSRGQRDICSSRAHRDTRGSRGQHDICDSRGHHGTGGSRAQGAGSSSAACSRIIVIVCALASLSGSCSAQRAQDFSSALVRYVDPFIGTGGHGHTYPGATIPSGMIQISPDSRNGTWDGCAGYHYSDSTLLGFSHKHLSGTGMGDLGDLLLMPTHARGAAPAYFPARFSHDREQAEAGYYAVELPENNIRVELTATIRAGFHRYTHPATEPLDLAIDLIHGIEDSPTEGLLTILNDSTIVGHRMSTGWARTQRLYFVLQFSRRLKSWRTNADGVLAHELRNTRGTNVRAVVEFPGGVSELLVKVGISGVSIDGVIRNLKAEIPHWDFGATRREASAAWEKELRKFAVKSEDEVAKKVFYTAVYHTLLAPVLFNDVDGSYRGGDGAIHTSTAFNNYHVFSLWDTFRTLHPLYTITQPQRTEDIVQSILAFGREYGLLPVWAFEGNETNTMIGYHSVPVIVDAYMKGVRGIDPDETFAALKKISQQKQRGLQFYSMQEPKDIEVRWSELRKERVEPDPEWWTESVTAAGGLVPGYAESLSGESIQYRSLYPDVKDALLVRAQEGKSIQWKTAPLPASAGKKPVTFIWAMGVASMRGAHTFRLRINGEEWFTFTTSLDGTQTYWKRRSGKGAELVFQAQWRDEYNDLFGHMYLSVPPQVLAPGTHAVIEVQGDSAGSADWYMTFLHAVRPRLRATQQFELVKEKGKTRQLVRLELEHLGAPADAVVRTGGNEVARMKLIPGLNTLYVSVDTVSAPTPLEFSTEIGGGRMTASCLLKPFSTFGYVPADREPESVSKTLEYAYDDWCIAQMARMLNKPDDFAYYMERAGYYRNLFDTTTGFMRGRNLDGFWTTPFNPLYGTHKQPQYTESNGWQATWFVPHDVEGLMALLGGRTRFIGKLDSLFNQRARLDELGFPPDISGLIGMYAHGNEPSHHTVYLYTLAGEPWKTQDLVRTILDSLYHPLPDGLCGNDDCGQMSAWYVMSALGFAPVNPCGGAYVIGAPRFPSLSVDLAGGKRLDIVAEHLSGENRYVQSVVFNGHALTGPVIHHADIIKGGNLTFVMGNRPANFWGSR